MLSWRPRHGGRRRCVFWTVLRIGLTLTLLVVTDLPLTTHRMVVCRSINGEGFLVSASDKSEHSSRMTSHPSLATEQPADVIPDELPAEDERALSGGSSDYDIASSANVTRLISRLMNGYDKRLRPIYKGGPVKVFVTMFVSSVSSISEVNMDFTLDFYFRQHWHDPRLNFANSGEDELCISNEMLDRIWWPDTFFANAKSAHFHTATTKNAFLRIKPSGWITQSLRLTVTASCRMDLTFFPMDTQVCSLEIESYAYSVKHITYKWKNDQNKSAVGLSNDVQLPQVKIKGYLIRERIEVLSTGNYSRLACEFYFARSVGYYVIQIYVPSSLIVVLSWVSFWLHRDAAPARVALGITTVLTMTTLISSTNASLPKISYLKSIDVYLVACFVMVFASIVEYAAVSYIGNLRPRSSKKKDPQKTLLMTSKRTKSQSGSTLHCCCHTAKHQLAAAERFDAQVGSKPTCALVVANNNVITARQAETTKTLTRQSTSSTHSCSDLRQTTVDPGNSCRSLIRKPYTELDLRRLAGVTLPPMNSVATTDDEDSPSSVTVGTTCASARSAQIPLISGRNPKTKSTPCPTTSTLSSATSETETRRRRATSLAADYGALSAATTNCRGMSAVAGIEVKVEKRLSRLSRASKWIRRRFGLDRWQWPPPNTARVAEAIDSYSRFAFPFMFLLLSVIYWTVYLHIRPTVVREANFVTVDDD